MKTAIKNFLSSFGYELNPTFPNKALCLDNSEFSNSAIDLVKNHTMLSNIKLATLYEQVVYFENNKYEGDFVECGVWKGGSVGIMAKANLEHGQERRNIHLFDSFTDICEPNPEIDGDLALEDVKSLLNTDTIQLTGKLKPIDGVYDSRGGHGTIKECKNLILNTIGYPENYIYFHKGWFQETLSLIHI